MKAPRDVWLRRGLIALPIAGLVTLSQVYDVDSSERKPPPGKRAIVTDMRGRPVQEGDVIAHLPKVNGACHASEPIGFEVSSTSRWGASSALTIDDDCRVIVTEITHFHEPGA